MASSLEKTENTGKSTLKRDEKGKEELLEAARKRVECEKRAMTIVERLLEDSVSKSFFEDCGKYITSKQFEDVAVERAIEKLCGYPLCKQKLVNIPRQQFHISLKSKKVFDITERKNFCSQRCYQAYKYYLTQLNDEPLWTRDHKRMPPIKLFDIDSVTDTRMKPPNEIPMKQDIAVANVNDASEQTTEGAVQERKGQQNRVSGLSVDKANGSLDGERKVDMDRKRQEMLRRIAESVERPTGVGQKEVAINSDSHLEGQSLSNESVSSPGIGREQEAVKHTETPAEQHPSTASLSKPVPTSSDGDVLSISPVMPADSENSDRDSMHNLNQIKAVLTETKDRNIITNSDRNEIQQPDRIEAVLAGSDNRDDSANLNLDTSQEQASKTGKSDDSVLPPDGHTSSVQTKKCQNNMPEQTIPSKDTSHEKTKKKKKKKKSPATENPMLVILQHVQNCIMEWRTEETMRYIYGDKERSDEANHDRADDPAQQKKALHEFEKRVGGRLDREELREGAFSAPTKPLPDFNHLCREEEQKYALKVKEFFMGKEISSSSEPAMEMQEKPHQSPMNPVDRSQGLPPVDSRAQVTIRRKILLDRLNNILPGIALSLQLSVHEVNPMMTNLVRTFHPGSHNIVFKPMAWTLLTVILIHILAEKETRLKESLESDHSVAFLKSMFSQLGLEVDVIRDIIKNFQQGVSS